MSTQLHIMHEGRNKSSFEKGEADSASPFKRAKTFLNHAAACSLHAQRENRSGNNRVAQAETAH